MSARSLRRATVTLFAAACVAPGAATANDDHAGAVAAALADEQIQLNVSGEPFRGATPYGAVRGVVDGHSHMMIDQIAGGNVACGQAWSPQGPAVALQDCPQAQVAGGAGDYLFNVFETGVTGSPTATHDPSGWPTFKYWPAWNVVLKQQVYYRWLQRAWRAGLRVYVMDAVDLGVGCQVNAYRTASSCDETANVERQIHSTCALQDYIDAQSGGPGKGWFRIVRDPFQARRVINAGKLAVVIGIETSELFGCGQRDGVARCDRAGIDRGLDAMQRLGVTSSFVCHKFDNALCGVAMDKAAAGVLIGSLQKASTGRFWDVETCTGPAHDEYQLSMSNDPVSAVIAGAPGLIPPGQVPVYPPPPHCNKLGLTDLGAYFIRGMVRRHMLVEVDHMSVRAREQALTLLESLHYSGVISSHSWADLPSLTRILDLGGIITPMAGPASSPASDAATPPAACCFLDVWKHLRARVGAGDGALPIGFADDMSGPSPQPPPQAPGMPKVIYPFRSFDGGTLVDRQHNGPRTYDINTDGVAHFGLFPDWWERLRLTAGQRVTDDLAAGAEAYLQVWERADGVPTGRCVAAHALLRNGRLRTIALGMTAKAVLRAAGQPLSRPRRAYRYCAAHGRVAVVFDRHERVELIASTAPGHRRLGIRPGARAAHLPRGGIYVVRRGRVAAVAIAAPKLADNPRALRRALNLAGVR